MLLKLIRNMCSEITILKLFPHPLGVNELTNFLSPASPWWRHQMATFRVTGPLCAGNSPVTSEPPAQRPVTRIGALFSLNCAWMNSWENNREAGDLRRLRANYDVPVMLLFCFVIHWLLSRNLWALFDTGLPLPEYQGTNDTDLMNTVVLNCCRATNQQCEQDSQWWDTITPSLYVLVTGVAKQHITMELIFNSNLMFLCLHVTYFRNLKFCTEHDNDDPQMAPRIIRPSGSLPGWSLVKPVLLRSPSNS